jgi:hypothetical protein
VWTGRTSSFSPGVKILSSKSGMEMDSSIGKKDKSSRFPSPENSTGAKKQKTSANTSDQRLADGYWMMKKNALTRKIIFADRALELR